MLQDLPPLYLQQDVYKCVPQPESLPISHSHQSHTHCLSGFILEWLGICEDTIWTFWSCGEKVARNGRISQEVGLLVLKPGLPGKWGGLVTPLLSPSKQSLMPLLVTSACSHVAWETSREPSSRWEANMVAGDTRIHLKTTDSSISFLLLHLAPYCGGVEHPQRVNS